jgi:hypothetical protein
MSVQPTDLTIEDVLADPMILALRRADGVDPKAFEALLRGKARVLAAVRPARPLRADPGAATPPAHVCQRLLRGGAARHAGSPRPW